MPKFTRRAARSASAASAVTIAPPSPTANGLVAWKEKISVSPSPPTGRPSASTEPKPLAESSSSGSPWARQAARHASRSRAGGAVPNVEQPSTPATRPACASSAAASASWSICQDAGSMSTNSGSKPAHTIAQAVAVKVNDGVTTSGRWAVGSPSAARSATIRPSVQLATGSTCAPPRRSPMRPRSSSWQGPPLE